jgi:Xaa-Pro aminopeptidase
MLLSAMRPGARISELQANGREIYRREGVPDPASAVIFFHGLGLSHMDIEQRTADGKSNVDWILEDGMVVPVHLLYPGGEHERFWLEEVVAIGNDGGKPLFSWGFGPLTLGSLNQTKSPEHAAATVPVHGQTSTVTRVRRRPYPYRISRPRRIVTCEP